LKGVVRLRQVPLLKLFLLGLCSITFGIYSYYLVHSLTPKPQVISASSWGEVAVAELQLREKPSTDSQIIKRLGFGQRIQLLGEQENWFMVQDSQGQTGWVYRTYVVFSPPGLQ